MFEKKFLAYLLYITLLEIRESAYTQGNSKMFYLADMLHNSPFALLSEDLARDEYKKVLDGVEELKLHDWLRTRIKEFEDRFQESKD